MFRHLLNRSVACFIAFQSLTCATRFALAQETINYASISGRVTDPSGAAVEGAEVSARQVDTNLTGSAVTGSDGRFRFPYLRLGAYEVKFHKQGFADKVNLLTLTAGAAFELPVALSVATAQSSVTVSAEAAVLEAARSQIAGTVPTAEIQNLPLN